MCEVLERAEAFAGLARSRKAFHEKKMTSAQEAAEVRSDAGVSDPFISVAAARPSMTSRIRRLATNNFDVITTVATSFGVFWLFAVQGIFLARLLGPEMRAEYGTVVLYTQTLTFIGLLGTLLSIAAHAARNSEALTGLRRAAIRLGIITGVTTAFVVAILALTALPAAKAYLAGLCILCALLLPFDHVRLTLLAVDHGSGHFTKYNRNVLFNAALLPVMLCVLWAAGIRSLHLIVAGTILIPLLSLIYRFASEGLGIIGRNSEPPIRTLLAEGVPYAFAQTSSDLFNRLDAILILWLASLKDQGYYTAAVSAASLMFVAPNALALFSFKSSARADQSASVGKVVGAGLAVAGIQLVTVVAILAVIEPLIIFVFGSSFRGAVPYAKVLLMAQAIGGLTYVAGGYLRGRRKSFIEVRTRIIAAAVIVAIALALRSSQGQMSVPIAALCGQATCASVLCWAVVSDARQRRLDRALVKGPAT
jgi:enterobacterial common antigen flippase